MKENNFSLTEAFKVVYDQRPTIYPNYGFQKQLRKYEIDLGILKQEEFDKEEKDGKMYYIDYETYS